MDAEAAGWVDGRDGFITWLRGEFAAANAIIDLLLAHLRAAAGDPAAEFDPVAAAVHLRRQHWAPVVHLQHYFPVAQVALALQHSAAARQRAAPPPRRYRARAHQRPAPNRTAGSERDGCAVLSRDSKDVKEVETLAEATKSSQLDSHVTNGTEAHPHKENSKVFSTPTVYVVNEVIDGNTVNVVEGLKLYKGFVDVTEVGKILSVVNDVKATRHQGVLEGRNGGRLQGDLGPEAGQIVPESPAGAGQTVLLAKRPMKGHGREIIQLGLPITEGPPEDENLREVKVDPVPGLLHDLFDRLVQQEVVPAKPDYCVIDFFNEGDYSHPHHSPPWYGRPFCTLCLTDCDMVFGRVIPGDNRGDYKGSLKFSLSAGSLVVLEGRSADIAKRALPATCKQRILLSFGKSVARKHIQSESSLRITPPLTPPMPWGPPSRSGNITCHHLSPKKLGCAPSNGVLAVPTIGPHQIPSDGMQTVFISPAHVTPASIPFAAAVTLPNTTTAWMTEAAPTPAPPRLPFQGTGVFLPSGSGHAPPAQQLGVPRVDAEPYFPQESSASPHDRSAHVEMANGNVSSSPTIKIDMTEPKPDCNGSLDGGSSVVHDKATVSTAQRNVAAKQAGYSLDAVSENYRHDRKWKR